MKWSAILAAVAGCMAAQPAAARETDAQVRKRIIQESIASYPGNCPCPYNTDAAGRSCGRRSAWSKPGGYSPKCYDSDIGAAEVAARRR